VELVETSVFTRQVTAELPPEDYRELQDRPARPGSRHPRLRRAPQSAVAASGSGETRGRTVIYYWHVPEDRIFLLFLYPKNVRSDLTPRELRVLRRLAEGG